MNVSAGVIEAAIPLRSLEEIWLRGYKTFFVLNSAEHEISTAHKN